MVPNSLEEVVSNFHFCPLFHESYATSYTTLPTAEMKINEFKRVQFSSLLLSTFVSLRKTGSFRKEIIKLDHNIG